MYEGTPHGLIHTTASVTGRYLARAGMLTLVVYAPCALAVRAFAPGGSAGLAWLWVGFAGVFMLARALTTGLRARTTAWMVTGA